MDVFDLVAKLSLDSDDYDKGLNNAESSASNFGGKLKNALGTSAKVVAGAVVTATTAVAGAGVAMVKATANVAEYGDAIDKNSQKLGLSAKSYQEWDYVMSLAGTSMSNMSTGLKTLTNKVDDAKNGSKDAQAMFSKLGISMDDLSKMSREDLFASAIKGFQGLADSTERASLANDLFGKSGQELTPLFNQSAESTEELIKQLNEMGGVMSDDAVKASADFEDALTTMKTSAQSLGRGVMMDLMPHLTNIMKMITENLPMIKEKVGKIIEPIMKMVGEMASYIEDHFDEIADVISETLRIVGVLFKGAWAGVEAIIKALKDAFAILTDALNETGTDWEHVWSGIATVLKVVGEVIGVAIKAIAYIIKGIILTINDVYTGIKSGIDKIVSVFNFLKDATSTAWNAIKSAITNPIQTAVNVVKSAIDRMRSFFNFAWSLPQIKLPHFSISGGFGLNPLKVPSFSVQWYKKAYDQAYELNGATIFGSNGGSLLGGGEAGSEMIVGKNHLMNMIEEASGSSSQIALLQEQNELLRAILQKDVSISAGEIFRSVRSSSQTFTASTGLSAFA